MGGEVMPQPQENQYSYADLLEWDENVRYELYNGLPVSLASPSSTHQMISGDLFSQLYSFLKGKGCQVFSAPLDVRLFEKSGDSPENVSTVVQPDLMVVCDREKIDWHGICGAPDMIIEITSNSTHRIDRLTKFNLYQRAGVREYWIVDPSTRVISVYILKNGAYHMQSVYSSDAIIPVEILDGCKVDFSSAFQGI